MLPSHPSTKVGRIALPKQVHFLCMAVCRWQIIWVDNSIPANIDTLTVSQIILSMEIET